MSRCLLFDSDGTLVDSELLNCEAMSAELAELGIVDRAADLVQRYRGWMLNALLDDLRQRHQLPVDLGFTQRFRERASKHFSKHLQPIPHIASALSELDQPMCVASNAPLVKINLALSLTGLAGYFGSNVFSAYEINSWKPDPELFLHAAKTMGYQPSDCVVIEDSAVGIEAALAAGIDAVLYDPENRAGEVSGVKVICSMSMLPQAVRSFE